MSYTMDEHSVRTRQAAAFERIAAALETIAQHLAPVVAQAPTTDAALIPEVAKYHLIFDGFPGPDGPRFIELENDAGHSIGVGEWVDDPRHPGWAQLVLPVYASPIIDAKVAEDARAIRIAILKALYGNDVGERPEPTLELLFALIAVAKSGRATPTAANASEGDDLEKGLRKALVHVEEVRVSPQWSGQHADWICGAIRFELEQALLGLLAAAPASPDTKEQVRG